MPFRLSEHETQIPLTPQTAGTAVLLQRTTLPMPCWSATRLRFLWTSLVNFQFPKVSLLELVLFSLTDFPTPSPVPPSEMVLCSLPEGLISITGTGRLLDLTLWSVLSSSSVFVFIATSKACTSCCESEVWAVLSWWVATIGKALLIRSHKIQPTIFFDADMKR